MTLVRKAIMDPGDTLMPFGKHRGARLRDIPIGYLDWVLGLDDLRDTLRADIEAFLKRQAEYDQEPKDWKEGREDYIPDEDE